MASVSVIYPSGSDFDLEYYLKTHMPLVGSLWGPHGLKSWEVIQYEEGSPYQIQAILSWDSLAVFNKAAAHETATKIFGDVPNFTSAKPILVKGESKGLAKI